MANSPALTIDVKKNQSTLTKLSDFFTKISTVATIAQEKTDQLSQLSKLTIKPQVEAEIDVPATAILKKFIPHMIVFILTVLLIYFAFKRN